MFLKTTLFLLGKILLKSLPVYLRKECGRNLQQLQRDKDLIRLFCAF